MFPEGKKKTQTDGEVTHEPIDVLVDIIIGFLEKSTAYLKTTANQVFMLLSGSVRESTINLILTVSIFIWKIECH